MLCASPTCSLRPARIYPGQFEPEVQWIRQRYEAGATIAAVCTGAVLLAKTGLLEGQEATSHWAYCELLGRQYPTTRWKPEKALVTAGVGQRLVMAGSGTSWHTLALYLIARFVGAQEAIQVARLNVIDWSSTSPLAYAALSSTAQVEDPVISRCQEWIAIHYPSETAVASMIRMSGLAERTFQRRFARATGHAPIDYVHTLRIEEAKQLLESTELPVEAVALEVGYQDATFFRAIVQTPGMCDARTVPPPFRHSGLGGWQMSLGTSRIEGFVRPQRPIIIAPHAKSDLPTPVRAALWCRTGWPCARSLPGVADIDGSARTRYRGSRHRS